MAGAVLALFLFGCEELAPKPEPPERGSIHVASTPAGARVFFDGSDTGRVTPYTISDVSAGSHTIRLTLAENSDWGPETVSVTAGRTANVNATLKRKLNLPEVTDQNYTVGTAISPLTLPQATGGDAPLRYSLTPTVPGLSFDRGSRILSGIPTRAGVYAMSYQATDSDDDQAERNFTITVRRELDLPEVADQNYTVGTAISPWALPQATGGDGALRYSLTPTVPGLSFDPVSRILSGTPTTANTYDMTYTTRDSAGRAASLTFTIAVTDTDLIWESQPIPSQLYTAQVEITPLQLPSASGGKAPLSYSLEPTVPGLTFNDVTRTLSGAPTEVNSFANVCTSPSSRNVVTTYASSVCAEPTPGRQDDMPPLESDTIIPTPQEDAIIDAGIAADPDAPELTDEWYRRARPASEVVLHIVERSRRVRDKRKGPTKERISISPRR